jgi:hypothetical protein
MSQQRNCLVADVSISTGADNTVIAASTGNPIKIWKMLLNAGGGANNLIFKSGTTAFNAVAWNFAANQTLVLPQDDQPYFECAVGALFAINLSAATSVGGRIWYTLG